MRAFAPSSSLSPRRFPRRSGNGFWNADNVPASTACIRALAAASPSIAPGCTNSEAQRSGRHSVSRFQASRQIRPAWVATAVGDRDIRESATHSAYDHVVSILYCRATGSYGARDRGDPGVNNRFSLGWWQAVAEETVRENPVFGLGFGHDLAALGLANGTPSKATEPESAQEIAPQPSAVLPPRPEPATLRSLPVFGTISLTTPPPRP